MLSSAFRTIRNLFSQEDRSDYMEIIDLEGAKYTSPENSFRQIQSKLVPASLCKKKFFNIARITGYGIALSAWAWMIYQLIYNAYLYNEQKNNFDTRIYSFLSDDHLTSIHTTCHDLFKATYEMMCQLNEESSNQIMFKSAIQTCQNIISEICNNGEGRKMLLGFFSMLGGTVLGAYSCHTYTKLSEAEEKEEFGARLNEDEKNYLLYLIGHGFVTHIGEHPLKIQDLKPSDTIDEAMSFERYTRKLVSF